MRPVTVRMTRRAYLSQKYPNPVITDIVDPIALRKQFRLHYQLSRGSTAARYACIAIFFVRWELK